MPPARPSWPVPESRRAHLVPLNSRAYRPPRCAARAENRLAVAWNTYYTPRRSPCPVSAWGGTAPPTRHQQWDSFGAFGFWCRTIQIVGKTVGKGVGGNNQPAVSAAPTLRRWTRQQKQEERWPVPPPLLTRSARSLSPPPTDNYLKDTSLHQPPTREDRVTIRPMSDG